MSELFTNRTDLLKRLVTDLPDNSTGLVDTAERVRRNLESVVNSFLMKSDEVQVVPLADAGNQVSLSEVLGNVYTSGESSFAVQDTDSKNGAQAVVVHNSPSDPTIAGATKVANGYTYYPNVDNFILITKIAPGLIIAHTIARSGGSGTGAGAGTNLTTGDGLTIDQIANSISVRLVSNSSNTDEFFPVILNPYIKVTNSQYNMSSFTLKDTSGRAIVAEASSNNSEIILPSIANLANGAFVDIYVGRVSTQYGVTIRTANGNDSFSSDSAAGIIETVTDTGSFSSFSISSRKFYRLTVSGNEWVATRRTEDISFTEEGKLDTLNSIENPSTEENGIAVIKTQDGMAYQQPSIFVDSSNKAKGIVPEDVSGLIFRLNGTEELSQGNGALLSPYSFQSNAAPIVVDKIYRAPGSNSDLGPYFNGYLNIVSNSGSGTTLDYNLPGVPNVGGTPVNASFSIYCESQADSTAIIRLISPNTVTYEGIGRSTTTVSSQVAFEIQQGEYMTFHYDTLNSKWILVSSGMIGRSPSFRALTYNTSLVFDTSLGKRASVTMTGVSTLDIQNLRDGEKAELIVEMSGGSYNLTFPSGSEVVCSSDLVTDSGGTVILTNVSDGDKIKVEIHRDGPAYYIDVAGGSNVAVAGGAVTSVNSTNPDGGGNVVLDPDDFDDTNTSHKFVSAADVTAIGTIGDKVEYQDAVALSDGATINWDISSSYNATVSLGAVGRTLALSNLVDGQTVQLLALQTVSGASITSITHTGLGLLVPEGGLADQFSDGTKHHAINIQRIGSNMRVSVEELTSVS